MKVIVKALPVLYACAGCPEFGFAAPRVAQRLDGQGLAEAAWLGKVPRSAAVTARYPIYSLDACDRNCAREWAEAQGAEVERAFVLAPAERDDPEGAAARIAAAL